MSKPRMITQLPELRRWWRDNNEEIIGTVFNDPDSFWADGELGVFHIVSVLDVGHAYILIHKGKSPLLLNKEEEQEKSKGF